MLASDMGLILTQHHAELLGAEMFGRRWPELKGSYRLYPEKFEQLWREAAEKYKGRQVIYAIGFRGQGDGPFWGEDNAFDTDEKRGAEVAALCGGRWKSSAAWSRTRNSAPTSTAR